MKQTIRDILDALRSAGSLDDKELDRILRANSARVGDGRSRIAKKHVLPFYLSTKQNDPDLWASWEVDADLERRFVSCVRMKPRRSASGVATITVITKPWPCSGDCIYCPNDIRMPKSYLHDEPACQRAERAWFDPYLQAASRLQVLELMGHTTDKVEMIVLGGNWLDYPADYRTWFATELFRALNDDAETRADEIAKRRSFYASAGIPNDSAALEELASPLQADIAEGRLSYNDAFRTLYANDPAWRTVAERQTALPEELIAAQTNNESSEHRMVGLVFETRPDSIDAEKLTEMRSLGCTKIQLGIQSLRDGVLGSSNRLCTIEKARAAVNLVRIFGFKIHEHLMANLPGSTPADDKAEFEALIADPALVPDELKLYPCSLVDGTGLMQLWRNGSWQPYSEDDLVDLLAFDVAATPPFMRISRMVRDIGAQDIVAGNKKANLRQDVDSYLREHGADVQEIRTRELAGRTAHFDELEMVDFPYATDVSAEHFLQWVDSENRIYGFLRLSLPHPSAIATFGGASPVHEYEAMIREVHVYGFAEGIGEQGSSAQHRGLGKALVERACAIAREAGYTSINVISAVGTRNYYRSLGFADSGLYLRKSLL